MNSAAYRLVAIAAVAAFSTPLLGQPARNQNSVKAVRFWSLGDTTRVVIETEQDFQYRSDRVQGPERLFFDVFGARCRLGPKGQQTIRVADKLLKQLRVAETLPAVTRVVFDIEPGVEFTASRLTNPSRLIVELRAAAPAQARTSESDVAVAKMQLPPLKVESAVEPVAVSAPPPLLPKSPPRLDKLPDPTQGVARAAAAMRAPKPATLGTGSSSMTRILGLKVGRIVIDAGHGGHDTGTSGPRGLLEKDLVLDVAKRVGALIQTRMGSEVIYTRSDDTFIALEHRTEIANEHKADLFLSIHANSSPEGTSSGVETYYLNFTTSKTAMEVAARENASSQRTVYDLKDLLQKIAIQDKVDESREFANKVQQALYGASVRSNSRTRDRGVRQAPFVVLIGASMPSILAEIGFISNAKDEALFQKPEFRQKIAEGLYKGLAQYSSTLSQSRVAASDSSMKPAPPQELRANTR